MEKHKPKESWQEPVAESEELGKEENENENNAVTWDDFIQNTTIHGVRYNFDRSFRIRRFEIKSGEEKARRPSPPTLIVYITISYPLSCARELP